MKTLFRPLCLVLGVSLALASSARAQSPVQAQLEIKKESLLAAVRDQKTKTAQVQAVDLDLRAAPELYLLSIAFAQPRGTAVARELAKVVETARVDKQLGSGSSASGSTSVTEKGAVPEILAFAVENGALTKSQSGTTISFKGNPVGIVNSLIANSLPPTGPLSRLAFGLEFDASRGSDESQAPVFEGDPQQLSAFSVKYEILNHRDPDSRQFQERADRLYAEAKSGTTTSTRAINQTLTLYESDFARTMLEPAHRAAFDKCPSQPRSLPGLTSTWRSTAGCSTAAMRFSTSLARARSCRSSTSTPDRSISQPSPRSSGSTNGPPSTAGWT